MRGFVVLALAGCGFTGPPLNAGISDATTDPDALGPDPDAPPGAACYGRSSFRVCVPTTPTQSIDFVAFTAIDTSLIGGGNCDFIIAGTPSICVISRIAITVETAVLVRATGPNPIVFGSTSTITVTGALDVASYTGASNGAAANVGTCTAITAAGASAFGAGGGAGGGFAITAGGGGGGHPPAPGGAAGLAIAPPATLRGGCPGGAGGDGTLGGVGGMRGSGGGAVGLFAATAITIAGDVDASGGGGGGGTSSNSGGGGGGSGGMIVLDGMTVSVTGRLYANGGGGGGGASAINGGSPGWQTLTTDTVTTSNTAMGGSGPPDGGSGGKGSTRANPAGGGMGAPPASGAGGGGGGAVGAIRVPSGQAQMIAPVNASPAPS